MRKFPLAIVAMLILPSAIRAELTSIQLSPAAPLAGEPVTVRILGTMPTLCWSLTDYSCGSVNGQLLGITVRTFDCTDQPCPFCYFAEVPIDVSCTVTFDAAGEYTIQAREIPDSLYYPGFPELTLTVAVSGSVQTDAVSWSAIKSLYR